MTRLASDLWAQFAPWKAAIPQHFVPADQFSILIVRVSDAGVIEVSTPPGYTDLELKTIGLAQSYLICGELKHQTPYVVLAPGLRFEVLDPLGHAARSPTRRTAATPDGFLLGTGENDCSLWQPILPSVIVRGRRQLLELRPAA